MSASAPQRLHIVPQAGHNDFQWAPSAIDSKRHIPEVAAAPKQSSNVGREWAATVHSALKYGDHTGHRCGSNPRHREKYHLKKRANVR
jgi:hypothetical protein